MNTSPLTVGSVKYWVLRTYDPLDGVTPIDADSTPTVAVRKNGSSVGDSVTVTKRTSTTGIYDCSYNPATTEAEGDEFTLEESVAIDSVTYTRNWGFSVVIGTLEIAQQIIDSEVATSDQVNDAQLAIQGDIASLNDFDPTSETVDANVLTVESTDATDYFTSMISAITGKILNYFRLALRKDAEVATDLSTELGEINADTGTGTGAYSNATDSLEATQDDVTALQTSVDGIQSGPFILLDTTVSSVTSTTSFVLVGGLATDDYYNGRKVIIVDNDDSTVRFEGEVSDYVGSSKTLTVGSTPSFTVAASDRVYVLSMTYFDPAVNPVIVGSATSSFLSSLANSEIEVVGVMLPGGVIQLVKGDDYIADQIIFTEQSSEDWPTLTGATVTFEAVLTSEADPESPAASDKIDIAGTIVTATGSTKQIKFNSMTKTVTAIAADTYDYHVRATLTDGQVRTLRYGPGKLTINPQYKVPDA